MAYFNIINPSDPYTIESDDREILAIIAVLFNGRYAFEEVNGDTSKDVPILFLSDPEIWFKETFGKTIKELYEHVFKTKAQLLADTFDSVLIGDVDDRLEFFRITESMTPEDKQTYYDKYHDKNRSSYNDIGKYAKQNAAAIRKKINESGSVV